MIYWAGVIFVIEKHLNEYLDGSLSNPSPCDVSQTSSAPVHNMFSEQTFDHHMRRARNSTVGFIDGKVKSNKNNTLAWLEDKHADEQDKIIVFSIAEAQKMQTELKIKQEENIARFKINLLL